MNINEQLSQGQKEAGISAGSYFKFKVGDNRIRILTQGEVMATHFFGKGQRAATCYGADKGCPFHGINAPKDEKTGNEKKPSIKYVCYIIDKSDNSVQVADLPYSVITQIGAYQENVDYRFETFPMPYDVTVKFDDKAAPAAMYKVIASPKFEPVSEAIMGDLAEVMVKSSPADMVKRKKDWQMSEHKKSNLWVSPENAIERRKKWVEDNNKERAAKGEAEQTIEYPENEISADDIGF